MKYSPQDFYESMPEWKRKKDPLICRLIYRPLSFVISSICANFGIMANTVSYFSVLVAIVSGLFFLGGTKECNLIAAVFVNLWNTLDCVDGNLARTVKKQPFGEFADGISGYIITAIVCFTMGYGAYKTGGLLFAKGNILLLLLGSYASISDSLMRLIYQKYKATLRKLADEGMSIKDNDNHNDHSQVTSLKTRIEETMGFGGILPAVILLGVLFDMLDIVVLYCAVYYGGACIVMIVMHIRKAIKYEKMISN